MNAPAPYRVHCHPSFTEGLCPASYMEIAKRAIEAFEAGTELVLPLAFVMEAEKTAPASAVAAAQDMAD